MAAPAIASLDLDGIAARFDRDGFAVVEGMASPEDCTALIDRAHQILRGFDAAAHRTVFTTDEQSRHSDAYFLASAGAVSCFFEEEAFDPVTGELRQPVELSINKIGHALHDLDPVFAEFSHRPALGAVARAVGMRDPLLLQSMEICKQPRIGGEVGCHQDATFLYTDPITVTGFWFALEDATLDNGCLWAAPGGHRTPLRTQFRRNDPSDDTAGTHMHVCDDTPLPDPHEPGALVPLEVPAGTLVVLHGLLPHWSDANRSGRSRHAYALHCIDAGAHYPAWNWLQRPATMPLTRFADPDIDPSA
jgi:phytanoyl-CoA hydroxylase